MFRLMVVLSFALSVPLLFAGEELVLLDVSQTGMRGINPRNSEIRVENNALLIDCKPSKQWPGFNMGKRDWNLEDFDCLLLDVANLDDKSFDLHIRLDSPDADPGTGKGTISLSFPLAAGETKQCKVLLPAPVSPELQEKFFGMRTNPDGKRVHGQKTTASTGFRKNAVVGMSVFLNQPSVPHRWTIRKIVAAKDPSAAAFPWMKLPPDKFFPMVDRFGQFKHKEWPGKIHSEEELKAAIAAEEADLAEHPGPTDRNRYGSDAKSPKYAATGHFRAEKIDGKWWLIDPDGARFWSYGMDCVRSAGEGTTPIDGREFYFEELPPKDDPLFKVCYGTSRWAVSNWYYQEHTPYTTYSFQQANLIRKYGGDWKDAFRRTALLRLRSWGFNTIANWSERAIWEAGTMPYTPTLGTSGRKIEGSSGYWGKLIDPFSDEFDKNIESGAQREGKQSGNDPRCLGYFVDNELSWGKERSLALGALASPADQPAKIVFVDDLKKKYDHIDRLNVAWGTKHADWNALLQSREPPDETKAGEDLDAFHKKGCDKYFRTIRDALKKAAPDKLYLGCRFAWSNETAVRASAEYCDVVSFNVYKRSFDEFKLPEGIDKPVIIGEFSFAATDVGFFDRGLVNVPDQKARGLAIEQYVDSALEHPNIVGVHWFQYCDYSVTGRSDAANVQAGFVDVCDRPYRDSVRASRSVGERLYKVRSAAARTTSAH